jgi:cation-transporting ATPase E
MEQHKTGLTADQVRRRIAAGSVNAQPQGLTPTIGRIYRKNILTLFNMIMASLGLLLIIAGRPAQALFLGIAVINTALGIFQEIRSKRKLDKLSILSQSPVRVFRDGNIVPLPPGEIVLDDILLIGAGEQVAADSIVVESEGLEANESLLTGESDNIQKKHGDTVLSGSFIAAGRATVKVSAVGSGSFATALTAEAKKVKTQTSRLMRILRGIIRVLAVAILPLGGFLFYRQLQASGDWIEALVGSATAIIGMIPQGLVMLTGITMTVSAVKLTKHKALVQSLDAIETLARVNMLCLDKTGTITDGTLTFEQMVLMEGQDAKEVRAAVAGLMGALKDDNATAAGLRKEFGSMPGTAMHVVPFSSARKWSGATVGAPAGRGGPVSYIIGAPAFVFPKQAVSPQVKKFAEDGFRVLCIAKSSTPLRDAALPPDLSCMALLVLSDTVRANAPDTFRHFIEQGVTLKVISGDDPLTVSHVAGKAGIPGAERFIDMSRVTGDLSFIIEDYTVFGRVSPSQKRDLIRAMKRAGHTTCMTGDGVNDVIAMKEADCAIAMINGSAAARGASDFVLMTSDFSAMTGIMNEGRRVINNIESVAALFMLQVIYAMLLTLTYSSFLQVYPFPYEQFQMTPVNFLTVGLPSFFLALRKNYSKPQNRFVTGILEHSLPAAVSVLLGVLALQAAGILFELQQNDLFSMNIFIIGIAALVLLVRITLPLSKPFIALYCVIGAAFSALFLGAGMFDLENLVTRNVFFYLPVAVAIPYVYGKIGGFIRMVRGWWRQRRED